MNRPYAEYNKPKSKDAHQRGNPMPETNPEFLATIGEREDLLRRRLQNPDEKKRFRTAYGLKAGADYSTLKPYCEDIVVVVDGFSEHVDIVRAKLELGLKNYDSDKDVLVMIGRSIDNMLVGMIVAQKIVQKPKARQSFAIAVYYASHYKFYEVYLDPTIETTEMQYR